MSTTNGYLQERAYSYTYDPMNRLKSAQHHRQLLGAWASLSDYTVDNLIYDKNGNIESLDRKGAQAANMDAMGYTYDGNQLLTVTDNGIDDEGFKDGNAGSRDYFYDANGNMIKDLNKGITHIAYNHLNLPESVEKGADNYIDYIYDAAGVKLAQEVYEDGDPTKGTHYIGGFIYEQEAVENELGEKELGEKILQLIQHEEGRIVKHAITGAWEYQYHLKDHLGNTRMTFTTKPKILDFKLNYESSTVDTDDEDVFTDLDNIIQADIQDYVHEDETFNHDKVQRLTGAEGQAVGSVLTIPVGEGDKIDASVYTKYLAPTGTTNPAPAIGSLIMAAISGKTGPMNYEGTINTAYAPGGQVSNIISAGTSDAEPMVFINLLFLSDDITQPAQFTFGQITGTSSNTQAQLTLPETFVAPDNGYIVVYLSNENEALTEVFFDDMLVTVNEHPVVQRDDYYPFGLTFNSWQRSTAKENKYLFNGKEKQDALDIDWLDYGARMYQPELGRWNHIDPKSELYFGTSPYVYALNQPTQAIDPDGKIVIFINGNHFGDGGKSDYWRQFELVRHGTMGAQNSYYYTRRQVGQGFDEAVMSQFNDNKSLYRDGSIGGFAPFNLSANSLSTRWNEGNKAGERDAEMIISNLARDKNGNIVESIKVVTHSMGGAYAKGYIRALKKYIRKNNITGVNIYEYDFAPYQSGSQTAVDGVPTAQFSHDSDMVAGNDPIKGAGQVDTSDDKSQGHSIFDFMGQVSKLPAGNYKVVDGKIIPVKEKKKKKKKDEAN